MLRLPKLFLYFLGAFFIINLIQSHFTELIFDEAYYWYYAQNMSWGYFDHPPMVALLIKTSSFFFDGELGVRFMSCVLSTATFIFLWLLVENPKKNGYIPHFFVLVFSMTLLNAYGFFTLPDTPLLFFAALFLWVYKKFIRSPSLVLSIAMGVVIAALMYSKYHAVLVIVLILLSNPKLVFNKLAWLSVIVALLCYMPHFLWLYENDFVSIKYHLFERPNDAYRFTKYSLGFIVNLIAVFGLTFPWIYQSLFKTKASDKFTRALLFLTYGVLLFFFISSFNRRVQTQWIILICIPLAVLSYNYLLENKNNRKWIFRTGIINIIILLFLRIGLVYKPIFPIVYETHGNKKWVKEIQSQVGDIPIIFENSYRNAPMYAFYSGSKSYSLNNLYYRQNQYSIDNSESEIQGKKILYVTKYWKSGDISYTTAKGTEYYGMYMEDFESFRKLKCIVEGKSFSLDSAQQHLLKVYNPYGANIPLTKLKFATLFLNKYKKVNKVQFIKPQPVLDTIFSLKSKDTTYFKFNLPLYENKEHQYFKIGITENGLSLGLNGENIKLQ